MARVHNRFYVAVSNPEDGPSCFSVSRLFRRTADSVDNLGQVNVHDLVLLRTPTVRGELPVLVVYYGRLATSNDRHNHGRRRKAIAAGGSAESHDAEHRFVGNDDTWEMIANLDCHEFYMNCSLSETDFSGVPKLLRRCADLIDLYGDVNIDDIFLDVGKIPKGRAPTATVYYSRYDHVESRP
jgi:hypothetical protein